MTRFDGPGRVWCAGHWRRKAPTHPAAPEHTGRFAQSPSTYRATRFSLRALAMTETELKLIAALAMIGLSRSPKTG